MMRLDDELLNAYADGELDGEERVRVETLLADDPDARERLAAIRRVSLLGRAAVDGLAREPVPEIVRERVWPVQRATARATRAWSALGWAALIFLGLGLGIGSWLAPFDEAPLQRLTARPVAWYRQAVWYHDLAAERHARSQPLPLDLEHSSEAPLQTGLAQRLQHPIVVPDLSSQGLELLGARLLVQDLRPLAQVFYRDPRGGLVSLLVALDSGANTPPSFQRVEQTPVLSWREDGTAYVLAGDAGRERLHGLAVVVLEQTRR